MVGFVGAQARRRRRNRIIFIIIGILIILMFFYLPSLDLTNEPEDLPNEILPIENEDTTSLISDLEELKLDIFQKDQRIKFRDNQIIILKEEYWLLALSILIGLISALIPVIQVYRMNISKILADE